MRENSTSAPPSSPIHCWAITERGNSLRKVMREAQLARLVREKPAEMPRSWKPQTELELW